MKVVDMNMHKHISYILYECFVDFTVSVLWRNLYEQLRIVLIAWFQMTSYAKFTVLCKFLPANCVGYSCWFSHVWQMDPISFSVQRIKLYLWEANSYCGTPPIWCARISHWHQLKTIASVAFSLYSFLLAVALFVVSPTTCAATTSDYVKGVAQPSFKLFHPRKCREASRDKFCVRVRVCVCSEIRWIEW